MGFTSLLIIGTVSVLIAQPKSQSTTIGHPYLVKDINTATQSSMYIGKEDGIALNGTVYFVADDGYHGPELWRSDGVDTHLVKDINPFEDPEWMHIPTYLTVVEDALFFIANDGEHGWALWRSDGTENGTYMVKDTNWLYGLTAVGDTLFFLELIDYQEARLWSSDGTEAGTHPLLDESIQIGGDTELVLLANNLYFTAYTPESGWELWRSDGTIAGTSLVKDIAPGSSDSNPHKLTVADGTLYFVTGNYYSEGIWRTDGTEANTQLVIGQAADGQPLATRELVAHHNELYFTRYKELWHSDGTLEGTHLIMEGDQVILPTISQPNDVFYFVADVPEYGFELWQTNGTVDGTKLVLDIFEGPEYSWPQNFAFWNNALYFNAIHPDSGREVWRHDGNVTELVADLNPGSGDSYPFFLLPTTNALFFTAYEPGTGIELRYLNDQDEINITYDINQFSAAANPYGFTATDSLLFFMASNYEMPTSLWRSDGTDSGTYVIKMPDRGSSSYEFGEMAALEEGLYFVVYDSNEAESGLWHSDGTPEGTQLILPAIYYERYGIQQLTAVEDMLFFTAYSGSSEQNLWRSDGTAAGTVIVPKHEVGCTQELTSFQGKLFCVYGGKLVMSDGRDFSLIKEFESISYFSHRYIRTLTVAGDQLFFAANDGQHGTELWVTDGTVEGTRLVKDLISGEASSDPNDFIAANDIVFFLATHQDDIYLWRSDGTADGTQPLITLESFASPYGLGYPGGLDEATGTENGLFFAASNAEFGKEIWQSNGTVAGTVQIADINPGEAGSYPIRLTAVNNTVFFSARNDTYGREYWYTTGAETGVALVQDINIGKYDGDPPEEYFAVKTAAVGNKLFFTADNGNGNLELWAVGTGNYKLYLSYISRGK